MLPFGPRVSLAHRIACGHVRKHTSAVRACPWPAELHLITCRVTCRERGPRLQDSWPPQSWMHAAGACVRCNIALPLCRPAIYIHQQLQLQEPAAHLVICSPAVPTRQLFTRQSTRAPAASTRARSLGEAALWSSVSCSAVPARHSTARQSPAVQAGRADAVAMLDTYHRPETQMHWRDGRNSGH